MKCPKCLSGELLLTDSGAEPENQEEQWVRCDNDEIDCDFTDDNDEMKYEELQPWYGFEEEISIDREKER